MARKASNTMTDALWLVGGSVVGAGLALLFAPCSGERSRKRIARFGKTMSRKGESALRSFNDGVSDFAGSMSSMGKRASGFMTKWQH